MERRRQPGIGEGRGRWGEGEVTKEVLVKGGDVDRYSLHKGSSLVLQDIISYFMRIVQLGSFSLIYLYNWEK